MLSSLYIALFAACVAIVATISIEKLGGALGGLLSSMPSTVVPASLGFWLQRVDEESFQHAVYVIPLGMFVNACFLYSWRVGPPIVKNRSQEWYVDKTVPVWVSLGWMVVFSLGVWSIGAFMLVLLLRQLSSAVLPYISALSFFSIAFFGWWACRAGVPTPKGTRPVSIPLLLSRGVLAGLAIGYSTWMASLGYPILAGMASVFPAIFLTTMLSVSLAQGQAVQAGAVGPMMLGSSSVAVYAILTSIFLPMFGTLPGMILSWVLSVCCVSLPAWFWLKRQQR